MALRPARPDAGPSRIICSRSFVSLVQSSHRLGLVVAWLAVAAACTVSEPVRPPTGMAGDDGQGAGGDGASGSAGAGGEPASSGAAGTSGGTAGNVGAAGAGAGATTGAGGKAGSGGATGGAGNGAAGAGAAGADGGATSDASTQLTYAYPIGPLLKLRCGGCHLGTEIQAGFSISYANVLAHVSAVNSNCPSLDASKARVVPGKPENSLIYIKTNITANPPGGCGGHMPYQGTSLSADQYQQIHDWILQGAQP
jgi:hypothetical protein